MDRVDPKNVSFDKLIRGKNVNFLIGAGASVPLYSTLSLGDSCPSFEEVVSDKDISDEARMFMYLYYFTKWIDPMGYGRNIFEVVYGGYPTSENYKALVESLYGFLYTESNERPKRVNIFSTNYDLLLEYAFDDFSEMNCINPWIL